MTSGGGDSSGSAANASLLQAMGTRRRVPELVDEGGHGSDFSDGGGAAVRTPSSSSSYRRRMVWHFCWLFWVCWGLLTVFFLFLLLKYTSMTFYEVVTIRKQNDFLIPPPSDESSINENAGQIFSLIFCQCQSSVLYKKTKKKFKKICSILSLSS